jgi:hypothetical protein
MRKFKFGMCPICYDHNNAYGELPNDIYKDGCKCTYHEEKKCVSTFGADTPFVNRRCQPCYEVDVAWDTAKKTQESSRDSNLHKSYSTRESLRWSSTRPENGQGVTCSVCLEVFVKKNENFVKGMCLPYRLIIIKTRTTFSNERMTGKITQLRRA